MHFTINTDLVYISIQILSFAHRHCIYRPIVSIYQSFTQKHFTYRASIYLSKIYSYTFLCDKLLPAST